MIGTLAVIILVLLAGLLGGTVLGSGGLTIDRRNRAIVRWSGLLFVPIESDQARLGAGRCSHEYFRHQPTVSRYAARPLAGAVGRVQGREPVLPFGGIGASDATGCTPCAVEPVIPPRTTADAGPPRVRVAVGAGKGIFAVAACNDDEYLTGGSCRSQDPKTLRTEVLDANNQPVKDGSSTRGGAFQCMGVGMYAAIAFCAR